MKNTDQKERESFLSSLDSYLARGLDQMALSQTIERLNRFPDDVDVKMAYCNILMKMEKFDEAHQIIMELENTFLNLSKIYAHQGNIYQIKGLPQKAIACYEKFLSLNPDAGIAAEIQEKIESLRNSSNAETASTDEDEDQVNQQVASHFRTVTMADLYIRQGHLGMAEDILKEILQNDPGNTDAAKRLREITNGPQDDDEEIDHKSRKINMVVTELEGWLSKIRRIKNNAVR